LHCGALHLAIFQLPRRASLAKPAAGALALVPSHAGRAQESVGRLFSRCGDCFHCLEVGEARAVVEKPASSLKIASGASSEMSQIRKRFIVAASIIAGLTLV